MIVNAIYFAALGDAREDMKKGKVPHGMTKDIFLSMRMEVF